jgi:pyruvate-formate lyase
LVSLPKKIMNEENDMAHNVYTELELDNLFDLNLRTDIAKLRDIALTKKAWHGVPTMPLIDGRSWSRREIDEDWLIWRAKRVQGRLREMPIEIFPEELIVGRPEMRPPNPDEVHAINESQPVLSQIPPFPGGDAGHFHPDFDKLLTLGIQGIMDEIKSRMDATDDEEKRTFYRACEMAIQGFSEYAVRVAGKCSESAKQYPEHAESLHKLSDICLNISTEPPKTFHEAIELMYLGIISLWFGEDHGLTTPGRMDQTLRPFYEADINAGRITWNEAFDLICCLYIQTNMILGPGSAESVIVGGRDGQGHNVTNDLTYLCLSARMATKLVYPTVGLAWHEGTPSELTDFACKMISTGIGDPAFFNDELIAEGLRDHGVSYQDSYNYMNSTCVEIKVCGASHMWVTAPYFNCPNALLEVMDMIADGRLKEPSSFRELNTNVQNRIAEHVKGAAQSLDRVWYQREKTGCFPLASCLISDCLEKGLDFDRGGARYNWVENSFVGLANLVDSLVAINELIYQTKELTILQLRDILKANYEGHEDLRQRVRNRFPAYGNDHEEIDSLAVEWAHFLEQTTESNIVGLHKYVPGFFCWVMHEVFGSGTGATPDGRKAGFPLADGAGASQGREKSGPTASILSTTKWDHKKAIGGLVQNVRFSKNALRTEQDLMALRNLIETYMRRGGFEIQVNVLNSETLKDAQLHPENYPDLLVRVAGYSDYFIHLNPNMQAEVIARTEHESL